MNRNTIIFIAITVFLLFCLYLAYQQFAALQQKQSQEPVLIREVRNGKIPEQISGDRIKTPEDAFSYTYNVWLNVQDITYKQSEWKHIFHKGYLDGSDSQPGVWLTPDNNNIEIRVNTYKRPNAFEIIDNPTNVLALQELDYVDVMDNQKDNFTYQQILEKNTTVQNILLFFYKEKEPVTDFTNKVPIQYMLVNGTLDDIDLQEAQELSTNIEFVTLQRTDELKSINPNISKFSEKIGMSAIVENYPLKKWFLLTIITGENSLDIYMDGNLYKTQALNGFVKENDGDVFVTVSGGFGGWINQLQYINKPLVPWQVRNTYLLGPNAYLIPDFYTMFNSFFPRIQFPEIVTIEEECPIPTPCPCLPEDIDDSSSSDSDDDSSTDDDED